MLHAAFPIKGALPKKPTPCLRSLRGWWCSNPGPFAAQTCFLYLLVVNLKLKGCSRFVSVEDSMFVLRTTRYLFREPRTLLGVTVITLSS
jgi:hypothetical protein